MYSTYDKTRKLYKDLHGYQKRVRSVLSAFTLLIVYNSIHQSVQGISLYLWLSSGFIISYYLYDHLLTYVWPQYSDKRKKEQHAKLAMDNLCGRMANIINSVQKRSKGEQFKKAYELSGKTITDFEHILGIAMKHEVKEVWVTAFCRQGIVVRATATIGSAYSCRPSEDVRNWPRHVNKLNCDEIRHYHNHPINTNETRPSTEDRKSNISIRTVLGVDKDMMKTFIIFWNQIYEYRIMEYFDNGNTNMHYVFDVAD